MESDNNPKSVLDGYLEQNKAEAQKNVSVDAPTPELASFWIRWGAAIVDGIIISVGSGLIMRFIKPADAVLLPLFFPMVVQFMYAGYFYSKNSATPGKMMLELEVVKESGERLTFAEGGFRDSVGKTISGVILFIGYLMALFRTDRHALHDLMFKTKVIRKTRVP